MRPYNILFLCTGNSARSIMAEAMVTTLSGGRFIGYSAGSHPTGAVNPFAVEVVRATGYSLDKLRSKSWDDFARPDAPPMDFIITVCDNAAGEMCPLWPGKPVTAHWGFPDPAAVTGTDEQKRQAFANVSHAIRNRLNFLLALPPEKLDAMSIQAIGRTPAPQ